MTDIRMPRLSDSMEQGTILRWLKPDGAVLAAGDELVEIETDKATMTYEAEAAGTLRIVAPEGATLAVDEPIAQIGADAADAPAASAPVVERPASAPAPAAPADEPPPSPAPAVPAGVLASPLARRLAAAHGVDLGALRGSGPRGRVTRGDVAQAAGVAVAPPRSPAPRVAATTTTPPPAAPPDGAKGEVTIEQPTRLQQVVARRMTEAKATMPDFQVETEVPMDEAIALRARLKELAGEQPAPSLNDLIVKACALALRAHPRANGAYRDGRFELYERVNVGVAVAARDALVVPTVLDADKRSLGEIAREVRRLAGRVREGTITPPELSGGTFTVSNLGMYGMTAITPVLNAPQAGILGVGATREQLVQRDGLVAVTHVMTLRLTCDHRILYGADAARFLADIRDLLAAPIRLAL